VLTQARLSSSLCCRVGITHGGSAVQHVALIAEHTIPLPVNRAVGLDKILSSVGNSDEEILPQCGLSAGISVLTPHW
jgi:hypothetical protein